MQWKLKEIIQETNHPFLNFYTFIYEVNNEGNISEYRYYMSSRKTKEHLSALYENKSPDGVIIGCYKIDENGEVSIVLTTQFRPAVNKYITSFPAGLVDENENVLDTAFREAKEEAGVLIKDIEVLVPPSYCSTGMTDESIAIVLGKIYEICNRHLENFEDISTRLVPLKEVAEMMNNEKYSFPANVRLVLEYLFLKFKIKS